MVYLCESLHLQPVAAFFSAILKMNDFTKVRNHHKANSNDVQLTTDPLFRRQNRFAGRVVQRLFGTVRDKRLAVFGFAFKAHTGDTRDSPAIAVCRALLADGARLAIFDPQVSEQQMRLDLGQAGDGVEVAADPYEAARGAHALLVCTEWPQFAALDYARIYHGQFSRLCDQF